MKIKYKQYWTTIPPISTKQTITFHHNSLNTKMTTTYMTYDIQVPTWDRHKTPHIERISAVMIDSVFALMPHSLF